MIEINVRADVRQATLFLRHVEQTSSRRAISRALNRTATTVRKEAAQEIQARRNLAIGVIKKQLNIRRSTVQTLTAAVTVVGTSIPMRHFASSASRKGGTRWVTVKITKGSKNRRLTKHGNKAFINPKWRPGVFVRVGKSRLPIERWRPVPGLPHVLVQRGVVSALRRVVARVFPPRVAHELQYEITKAERRYAR